MAFYHYLIEDQRFFSSYRPRVEFRALKLQNCLCVKEIAVDQVAIGAPVIQFLSHHKERVAIVAPITEACVHCLKSVDRSGKIKLLFVLGATLFMKEYPNSSLIGNANYWLGETYYARGLFEQAVYKI